MDHIGSELANIRRNIEIIGADPVTRFGFTQVPNFILKNPDLSVGAKVVYAMFLSALGHNFDDVFTFKRPKPLAASDSTCL